MGLEEFRSHFSSQPSSQMLSLLLRQPMKPLKATATTSQPVLTLQQIETIFYKIQDIYEIHKEFYDSLCPKVQQWDSNITMGHLFQKLVRTFPGASLCLEEEEGWGDGPPCCGARPCGVAQLTPCHMLAGGRGTCCIPPCSSCCCLPKPSHPRVGVCAASVPLAAAGMPTAGGSWVQLWWNFGCRRMVWLCCGAGRSPGVQVTLWREAGGGCLFAPGCPGGFWWWLPGVTLQVLLLLLWTCGGNTGCARGCCGHAGEGRRRGQVEGCWEAAVVSASTVIEL